MGGTMLPIYIFGVPNNLTHSQNLMQEKEIINPIMWYLQQQNAVISLQIGMTFMDSLRVHRKGNKIS